MLEFLVRLVSRREQEQARRLALVRDILGGDEMWGRDLRAALADRGVFLGGGEFYMLMGELERRHQVQSWYAHPGHGLREERMYRR